MCHMRRRCVSFGKAAQRYIYMWVRMNVSMYILHIYVVGPN
jgi:hypothetical protein